MTTIARSCHIAGVVEEDGDLEIAGRIEGRVQATSRVTVAGGGIVRAEVRARRVEVLGSVVGDIVADEQIRVGAGARVIGDLRAPVVELTEGASVEGRIQQPPPPSPESASLAPPARGGAGTPAARGGVAALPGDFDAEEPETLRTTMRPRAPLRRPEAPPGRPADPPVPSAPAEEPRPPRPPVRARVGVRTPSQPE